MSAGRCSTAATTLPARRAARRGARARPRRALEVLDGAADGGERVLGRHRAAARASGRAWLVRKAGRGGRPPDARLLRRGERVGEPRDGRRCGGAEAVGAQHVASLLSPLFCPLERGLDFEEGSILLAMRGLKHVLSFAQMTFVPKLSLDYSRSCNTSSANLFVEVSDYGRRLYCLACQ